MDQLKIPSIEEFERLRRENIELRKRLGLTKDEPVSVEPDRSDTSHNVAGAHKTNQAALSTRQKISIFQNLFRARLDVYAIRKKTKAGKYIYIPAKNCDWNSHKFDPVKKRYACGTTCVYLELTENVIKEHMQGKQTVGIYPLMQDDSCYLLAADFDKSLWQEDSLAFLSVCREFNVSASLERSRSGNGAHVWIFFQDRIPAIDARSLGAALITQTRERRYQVDFTSYDRLFPSQDSLPKGGFGNLIALPLQGDCVVVGNSVFVDDQFHPYENQWDYLSAVHLMTSAEVREAISRLSKESGIMGALAHPEEQEEESAPWAMPPSGRKLDTSQITEKPSMIMATLSNMLFINKRGLSAQVVARIARLAAFQNPEFYKKQALRLSTHDTPRVIFCGFDMPKHIAVPRGCESDLRSFCDENSINYQIDDKRFKGKPIKTKFLGRLRPAQSDAVKEMLKHDAGVLSATTAFGKTVVAAKMIAKRARNTLILVHRTQLLDQWRERLGQFLDIPASDIGVIGGGKSKPTGKIDIATLQSLQSKGVVGDVVAEYGHVIVDECHHIPAFTFERVLSQVKAKYIVGLTATPVRKNGDHPIIFMQCGPIRYTVSAREFSQHSEVEHVVIPRFTLFESSSFTSQSGIQALYSELVADNQRNELIINDVLGALERGRSPVIITERREHLEDLVSRIQGFAKNILVLHGGMTRKERKEVDDAIKSIKSDEERVIAATGQFLGEGFDDARLDTLFLAHPISWKGKLQQYAGRLHRCYQDKVRVEVYDYIDTNVHVLQKMYEKRLKGYRAIGYQVETGD